MRHEDIQLGVRVAKGQAIYTVTSLPREELFYAVDDSGRTTILDVHEVIKAPAEVNET